MTLMNRYNPPSAALDRVYSSTLIGSPTGLLALHKVDAGDTLQTLSKRYYNDSSQWVKIFTANRGLLGGSTDVQPGQVLSIPHG